MIAAIPDTVSRAMAAAACRLGRALDACDEQPEGAVVDCHEINAVLNLAYCLRLEDPKFRLYAEGTLANRGRVDLVATNGELAIAQRAISSGAPQTAAAQGFNQLQGLRAFQPTSAELGCDANVQRDWHSSKDQWAVVLLLSADAVEAPAQAFGLRDQEGTWGVAKLRMGGKAKPAGLMMWATAPISRGAVLDKS
jgi:hypothetical protein